MLGLKKLFKWLLTTEDRMLEPSKQPSDLRNYIRISILDSGAFLNGEGPLKINTLGFGGIGLDVSRFSAAKSLASGNVYNIKIRLLELQFSCKVECRHVNYPLVGFKFLELGVKEAKVLASFLKPRMLGSSLREIKNSTLQPENSNYKMRWFQGEGDTNIFIWESLDKNSIIQEFYFLDYYVSWASENSTLQCGLVEGNMPKKVSFVDDESIVFFKVPPYKVLRLARTILENSSAMDTLKDSLIRELRLEEKRSFHRYVSLDSELFFTYESAAAKKSLSVLNISLEGMALSNDNTGFVGGASFDGTLHISQELLPIRVKVLYARDDMLGCRIVEISQESCELLQNYLAPRLLAQYLEKAPLPAEKPSLFPDDSAAFLYVGMHNTHILTLLDKENNLVLGRFVAMDRVITVKRGKMSEYRCPRGLIFPGEWEVDSSLLRIRDTLDPNTIEILKVILENSKLSKPVKTSWSKLIQQQTA